MSRGRVAAGASVKIQFLIAAFAECVKVISVGVEGDGFGIWFDVGAVDADGIGLRCQGLSDGLAGRAMVKQRNVSLVADKNLTAVWRNTGAVAFVERDAADLRHGLRSGGGELGLGGAVDKSDVILFRAQIDVAVLTI